LPATARFLPNQPPRAQERWIRATRERKFMRHVVWIHPVPRGHRTLELPFPFNQGASSAPCRLPARSTWQPIRHANGSPSFVTHPRRASGPRSDWRGGCMTSTANESAFLVRYVALCAWQVARELDHGDEKAVC